MDNCSLCDRIKLKESYPLFIHEFSQSLLVVGEHQYFPGYVLLYAKEHVREMCDLSPKAQMELAQEMMIVSKILKKIYQPHKLNICSLGNVVEHLHWHFFPRYANEVDQKAHPWLHSDQFQQFTTTKEQAQDVIRRFNSELKI